MFLLDDVVVYSPTDITLAACPFELLRTLDEKLGRAERLESAPDPMMQRAAWMGDAHELRVLADYRAEFGPYDPATGRGVAEIASPGSGSEAFRDSLVPAREATFEAIRAGADVVFQGTFFDGRFHGRADFLLRERATAHAPGESGPVPTLGSTGQGPAWAVVDTKLTNHVRASALLQMAAYGDQLLAAGIPVANRVAVHHGNGERSEELLEDLLEVYRGERRMVESLLDAHVASGEPVSWQEWADPAGRPAVLDALPPDVTLGRRACGRCNACAPEVARSRDVRLVHGIRAVQRTRLFGAGVRTLADLADLAHPVPRLSTPVQHRLVRQARLQVEQLARLDDAATHGLVAGPGMRLVDADGAAPTGAAAEAAARLEPVVRFEVVAPDVLRALPPASLGDIYFDFEGDPMWSTSGGMEGGLEYLFGLVEEPAPGSDDERYVTFWAHNRPEERLALIHFLSYLRARRAIYPDMHVYHFANYERVALERLAERHGEGLEAVLTLVREGVLIDLFPVVRNAVAVSQASYSIKKLEPLYMGAELRESDGVTTGGDSVARYAEAVAARDAGDEATFEAVMAELATYNRYDCVSTRRLVQWLRSLAHGRHVASQAESAAAAFRAGGLTAGGASSPTRQLPVLRESDIASVIDAVHPFEPTARQRLAGALRQAAGPHPHDDADSHALALLASSLDYHRREDAPVWRAHFERLTLPLDWWAETRDVLVVDESPAGCQTLRPWAGGASRQTRVLRLEGDLGPGSTPEADRDGFLVYPVGQTVGLPVGAGAAYATTRASITEVTVSPDGSRAVLLVNEGAPTSFARGPDAAAAVPVALVPGPPIPTRSIEEVLGGLAEEVAGVSGETLVARAAVADRAAGSSAGESGELVVDPAAVRRRLDSGRCGLELLRRARPRLLDRDGSALPLPEVLDGDYVAAITAATAALDHSVLAVQGPPGTGKTYVGARVIARLVQERGWRIGVVAQSHAVVEHLLDEIVEAGLDPERVGKLPRDLPAPGSDIAPPPWTILPKTEYAGFLAAHELDGCVLGGTVWDLTHRGRIGDRELDLLVVDEAGQFSLANTLAASTAAQRLLLLGDPQQLPQVTQGRHDEPVDTSALAWIADGAATMPADRGYFIERTWRLHPDLCAAVSMLSYDGRLLPQPVVTQRRHLEGILPGVHQHLVTHRGSSTASPEEAAEVVRIVQDVLGRAWTPGGDEHTLLPAAPLEQNEVLVVAAYNAQVTCVRAALDAVGLTGVRVGTVDKFQGREAAVAVVTLAASSATEAPRGLEFLLNRNRLNVAVSRAKWAAYLVHSPGLTDALPHSGQGLADLGAFRRLCAGAVARVLPAHP